THEVLAEAEGSPRSRQADADLCHAVGLFQLLASTDYLGRKSADGDPLLHPAAVFGMGSDSAGPRDIPFCHSVFVPVVAAVEAQSENPGDTGGVADLHALYR